MDRGASIVLGLVYVQSVELKTDSCTINLFEKKKITEAGKNRDPQ